MHKCTCLYGDFSYEKLIFYIRMRATEKGRVFPCHFCSRHASKKFFVTLPFLTCAPVQNSLEALVRLRLLDAHVMHMLCTGKFLHVQFSTSKSAQSLDTSVFVRFDILYTGKLLHVHFFPQVIIGFSLFQFNYTFSLVHCQYCWEVF